MTIGVPSSPATRPLLCGIVLLIVGAYPAQPQSDKSEKTIHIPSSGGEVLIAHTLYLRGRSGAARR